MKNWLLASGPPRFLFLIIMALLVAQTWLTAKESEIARSCINTLHEINSEIKTVFAK